MTALEEFYNGKNILITGHNGFKGTWLTQWLIELGANVTGVSLESETKDSLFEILGLKQRINHLEFDIRILGDFLNVVKDTRPEIIFHLAAQPIVIDSFNDPVYTHSVNYIGTLNVLESVRITNCVKTLVVITSDKVYKPDTSAAALDESSLIGGLDPYSASKSAIEILVNSYRESFFIEKGINLFTARAGNVIGYGDWGKYRLLPDLFRSIINGTTVEIRNPHSVRPWQYVNDVVFGYLLIGLKSIELANESCFAINFGPTDSKHQVKDLVEIIRELHPSLKLELISSEIKETVNLVLDSTLAKEKLGWQPKMSLAFDIQNISKMLSLQIDNNHEEIKSIIVKSIHEYF